MHKQAASDLQYKATGLWHSINALMGKEQGRGVLNVSSVE